MSDIGIGCPILEVFKERRDVALRGDRVVFGHRLALMISEVVSNPTAAPAAPAPFAACHVELAAFPSGTALGWAVLGRARREAEAVAEAGGAAPGPRSAVLALAVMALAARCSGRAAGR